MSRNPASALGPLSVVGLFAAIAALSLCSFLMLRALVRRSIEENRALACYDGLTGLPSRRMYVDRLESSLRFAERDGSLVAACFPALDGFKRNYQFYSKSMNEASRRKLELESRLRRAVEHDELTLYYQPVSVAETQTISGAEALLRRTDPELAPVSPGEFVPLAEDTGLIVAIGEWALRTPSA